MDKNKKGRAESGPELNEIYSNNDTQNQSEQETAGQFSPSVTCPYQVACTQQILGASARIARLEFEVERLEAELGREGSPPRE